MLHRPNFLVINVIVLILVATNPINTLALAGGKDPFAALNGKFRGSGIVIIANKEYRISCQLSNAYDKALDKVKMSGKCANSLGVKEVSGAIVRTGNLVTGAYIPLQSNLQMTQSSGGIKDNVLTISASFIDKAIDRLIRIRQIIQISDSKFEVKFLVFKNKTRKYEFAGKIRFKRK